ncbi:uncharacterized protein [Primulina huaijiensis]|uniref:uncharacterized protein isoform X1 n=1 Tax=Primulina huaijiensis TaxID=1492673 RepID=UPI003CC7212E
MSAGVCGAVLEDAPLVILRFFKIMLNEEYSKILYLPPAFAREVEHLLDQETYLENSSGQRWAVIVSKVDDSLAFHWGWNEFFTQHSLMVGHFLEFHYIKGSHFLVRVYGRSGCERINFNKNGLKIGETDDKIDAEDKPIHKLDDAVPISKLEKRVGNKARKSCEKDAREDKERPSILTKKKESHTRIKTRSGKSLGLPTITPVESEVLVDVPILCAENYNRVDLSNLCCIKALANLENKMPNVFSGFQRGEGSKALLPAFVYAEDAAKNAETQTKVNIRTFS